MATKVKRGDRVLVSFRKHDLVKEGSCELWRAVKVDREGKVTHACSPLSWSNSPVRANAGNNVRYGFIRRVYVGVPDDACLEALDGITWNDVDEARAAIREALA